MAEYNASGAMLNRYVHGPGAGDDPLIWHTGPTTYRWTANYLYADRQGSIVEAANFYGNPTAINSYDEYGVPGPSTGIENLGRFRYTGQTWIPELGQYYYKARMYSPGLGRFMQTDPIGYADGMNMYRYVGNDPVNFVDFWGLNECPVDEDCGPDGLGGDEIIVSRPRCSGGSAVNGANGWVCVYVPIGGHPALLHPGTPPGTNSLIVVSTQTTGLYSRVARATICQFTGGFAAGGGINVGPFGGYLEGGVAYDPGSGDLVLFGTVKEALGGVGADGGVSAFISNGGVPQAGTTTVDNYAIDLGKAGISVEVPVNGDTGSNRINDTNIQGRRGARVGVQINRTRNTTYTQSLGNAKHPDC